MFSRQNIGGRKRKTKQSKAKNSNNKTLCAIFTWIVPRKYQNGCPNTTQPRPQGAFPWLWGRPQSQGKAPWGRGCVVFGQPFWYFLGTIHVNIAQSVLLLLFFALLCFVFLFRPPIFCLENILFKVAKKWLWKKSCEPRALESDKMASILKNRSFH